MKSPHREKTMSHPHRMMNKTSIYLAKQKKVDREDFLGYEAVVELPDNQSITIRSGTNLTPKDGRVFEYVLSQWQATKKCQEDLEKLEVDIPLIINSLGWVSRTENRKKIIQHLRNMANVTIIYNHNKNEFIFHALEAVEIIDGTQTVLIKLSDTYNKALIQAKERFVNISKAMHLKSNYAIELFKFLQIKGSGVNICSGEPLPVKQIEHITICEYLHLDSNTKSAKDEVFRAFKALEAIKDFPKYKFNGNRNLWQKIENLRIHNS